VKVRMTKARTERLWISMISRLLDLRCGLCGKGSESSPVLVVTKRKTVFSLNLMDCKVLPHPGNLDSNFSFV